MTKKIIILAVIIIVLGGGLFLGVKKYGVKRQVSIAPSITEIAKNNDSAQEGSGESQEVPQDAPAAIGEPKNPSEQRENQSAEDTQTKPVETPRRDVSTANGKIVDKLISWGFEKSTGRKIDTIIVHTSYNSLGGDKFDADKIIDIYKQYGVSAHYLFLRDGTIYRLVEEKNISWHAGASEVPDGRKNVNDFSIGIEVINDQDSKFTDAQYAALNRLIGDLKKKYPIKYILGHDDIAPGRKTDPWGIEWSKSTKMILQIYLDVNDVKLVLKNDRKTIDTFSWIGEYTLSEQLLPNIDQLLKKNKIDKSEVEKVVAKITKTSGVTSARIVQTVTKGWNVDARG